MQIFNSAWLVQQLSNPRNNPADTILSLFDILNAWHHAPTQPLDAADIANNHDALLHFLTTQAKACGASEPTMLAEQIIYIAQSALQKTMTDNNSAHLLHAKKVAMALIQAQVQKSWLFSKTAVYGMAASLLVMLGASALWLPTLLHQAPTALSVNHATTPKLANNLLTAHDASMMYAKYEQMRNGTCQFPEAIQIPDKDKAVYLENVVGGKLPTTLENLATANFYLEKVRCNYTPMLMLNSK